MNKAQILIVEDDRIVAEDIQTTLQHMGFSVSVIVSTGEDALKAIQENNLDLVLMDIVLDGGMDGIDTARRIRSRFDIPVVYLTAYADQNVLERAKLTEPFGYIIKPFEEKELNTTIEIALYKHKMEHKLKASREWFSTTLKSIGDAVIATDANGHVTFMNPVAESLTGFTLEEAVGQPLQSVFNIINEESRQAVESPVSKIIREGTVVGLANHTLLIPKAGNEIPIADSGAPIRDEKGRLIGVVLVFRDIRESKRAEETLRENEEKYRTLFENAPLGLGIADEKGKLGDYNDAMLRPGGYGREDIARLKNISELYYVPDERSKIMAVARDQGFVDEMEVQFKRKDGTPYDALLSLRPLKMKGKLCWQAMVQDITNRKRAQKALLQEKDRAQRYLDLVGVMVVSMNEKGEIALINRKGCQILGYKEEKELIGRDWFDTCLPSQIRKEVKSVFRQLSAGDIEPVEFYENPVITSSGEERIIAWHNAMLTDESGAVAGTLSSGEDITEHKRTEEALLKSEEKYRSLFNNIADSIFIFDHGSKKFLDCNQSALDRYGYSREELFSMTPYQLHPPDGFKDVRKNIEDPDTIAPHTYTHITKHGEQFPVEIHTNEILYQDRKAWISMVREISERKKAEEEKEKLQAQLIQSQKMEAIGTLAGGIAHDFNNILMPITLNTEMALLDTPDDSPVRYNLNAVFKAANRAIDLVQQILAFSRKTDQKPLPFKMSSIIKEALKLLRASIPKTIEIKQKIISKSDIILADPTRIHQVLMNLCTNAAHAMREKGGVLEVALVDEYIDSEKVAKIPALTPGSYLKLSVSDTGHGIESTVVERIFDPYFTTKGQGEGTGLGLAMVHGIALSYGGAIKVVSEPGKGTVFDVFLPKVEREVSIEAELSVELPKGNERILFVDDEKAIVSGFLPMLERLGYKVNSRTSAVEALEDFRKEPDRFDVVITDMTMPKITGVDLAKEILKIRHDIPVILCTGHSELINKEKAKEMGIRDFLMKPVLMREIATTIRKVLDE